MESTLPDKRLKTSLLLAAAISLTALWVRNQAKNAERQFPPDGKFLEIDGVRVHYIDFGTGPAVLLLHGNGSQASDFLGCGLIEQLGTRYRVIAIDRPGFGFSERPRDRIWTPNAQAAFLKRACEALGVHDAVVLGHSFGTLVALALALEHPAFVRGLVLVSGYYFPTFRLDALLLSPPSIPVIGDVMRYTISPLLGRLMMRHMLSRVFSPKNVDSRFLQTVPPAMMLRPWQLKASAEESAFMIPAAAALSGRYKEISQALEIVAGAEDKMVTQGKQSIRLHEAIPHSRLRLLPDVGHMLHYDCLTEVCDAVDRIAAPEGLTPAVALSRRV